MLETFLGALAFYVAIILVAQVARLFRSPA